MSQILELSWWFSLFPESFLWWFFCLLASLAALPLCLRTFRGLADKGASLSPIVGLIAVMFLSWWLSMEGPGFSPKIWLWRAIALLGAVFFVGVAFVLRQRKALTEGQFIASLYPALILILVACFSLTHGAFTIWLALLLLAGGSVACWWGSFDQLAKTVQKIAVPLLVSQLLFLTAFLFFSNVRSYLPYATFEIQLYQAEKWGNMTHMGSIMASDHMPPKDLWWNGWPTNYYYGGHLLTATIAKATGYATPVAFNLGLATVFALTMVGGFGFVFSLVHLSTRKLRLFGCVNWHSGMAWGLFGAFAITMFGNLDSWRQILTRDSDYGAKFRIERQYDRSQEEWKVRNGLPTSMGIQLFNAVDNAPQKSRAYASLYSTTTRLQSQKNNADTQLGQLIDRYQAALSDLQKETGAGRRYSDREYQDALSNVVLSNDAKRVYTQLTSINAVDFQERLFRDLVTNNPQRITEHLKEAQEGHRFDLSVIDSIREQTEAEMEVILLSDEYKEFRTRIDRITGNQPGFKVFDTTIDKIQERLVSFEAMEFPKNFDEISSALNSYTRILSGKKVHGKNDGYLWEALEPALRRFEGNPKAILAANFDGIPPIKPANIDMKDHRWSLANLATIDFWAPSRAIKSATKDINDSGTITEFPYFSAILGDHHPHHMAIPFTLCALCACLSLLRKTSRLVRTDLVYLRRAWPELLAMAFFIGSVFPVNIWDAVVLTPLYALVILYSLRNVYPSENWRWVGLGGFVALICFLVGLVYNTMPGATPLFQNFKFLLLAVGVTAAIPPVIHFFTFNRMSWAVTIGGFVASILLIFVGAMLAPGGGGVNPTPALDNALRDASVYTLILAIAASWTMGKTFTAHRWWYMSGSVYALVGGIALVVILPFKLFFDSPLQPSVTLFWDMMPPILSDDLINAKSFWDTFWKASPVNPFQEEIRTRMGDIINHWGLFAIPIFFGLVARYISVLNRSKNGFAFMVAMLAFGIAIFARNYLGFWPGALALGFMVLALFFAAIFKARFDGPTWVFVAISFFWIWFVEALHFDDDYSGYLERYNTPFKIYYPLWPMMAGAMIVSIRLVLGRFKVKMRRSGQLLFEQDFYIFLLGFGALLPLIASYLFPSPWISTWLLVFWIVAGVMLAYLIVSWFIGKRDRIADYLTENMDRSISHWPAFLAGFVVFIIGMHYPFAATMTRTQDFFSWPKVDSGEMRSAYRDIYLFRTLNGIEHYRSFPQYRQDYKAMVWARENLPRGTKIMELPGKNPYSKEGRISTGAGLPTIVSWQHHEHQWRGRAISAPLDQKRVYIDTVRVTDMNADFRKILGSDDFELSEDDQNNLRLSSKKEQLEGLRTLFPEATLNQLYRLRAAVAKNDVNMMMVGDRLWQDADNHYSLKDEEALRNLWALYGTKYLVIGKMERDLYGGDLLSRFQGYGFEIVFDSSAPEHQLVEDGATISDPTYILKVPEDFPLLNGGDE